LSRPPPYHQRRSEHNMFSIICTLFPYGGKPQVAGASDIPLFSFRRTTYPHGQPVGMFGRANGVTCSSNGWFLGRRTPLAAYLPYYPATYSRRSPQLHQ